MVNCAILVRGLLLITIIGNFGFIYLMLNENLGATPSSHFSLREQKETPISTTFSKLNQVVQDRQVNRISTIASSLSPNLIRVSALSSKDKAVITLNDDEVLHVGEDAGEEGRGIHIVTINQDCFLQGLLAFLKSIHPHRIIALCVRDEASFNLGEAVRMALIDMGSLKIGQLNWRDTWAMVAQIKMRQHAKDILGRSPDMEHWANPVMAAMDFQLQTAEEACSWATKQENFERSRFCSLYDGYGDVCNCESPKTLTFPESKPFPNLRNVPVVVIASENRGSYLLRTLTALLSSEGSNRERIIVSIDGTVTSEPEDVCRLLGIEVLHHSPTSDKNGRITQHYRFALTNVFGRYTDADYLIIIEEDLEAAPDFFRYFSATLPLLEKDPTLYCISAWNDQGYMHSSKDPTLLYRVETMPGLGWMLSRKLFKDELEPKWPGPDKLWDWDMWMRTDDIRKDRECIIPDVSRTFHFGSSGLNVNDYFQQLYFEKHRLNTDANAVVNVNNMVNKAYDDMLDKIILSSTTVIAEGSCENIVPDDIVADAPLVLYIAMSTPHDHDTWLQLAKCWKLWDLDVRGYHKGIFRFFYKEHPMTVVGTPFSPFSTHKPETQKLQASLKIQYTSTIQI
eukprot:gene9247-1529_t